MQVDCWSGVFTAILCYYIYDSVDCHSSEHLKSRFKDQSTRTADAKLGTLEYLLTVLRKRDSTYPDVEMPGGFVETMSELEGLRKKHTLTGMYYELEKFPELMERRLYIGNQKPDVPNQINKRSSILDVDVARSVCPSRTEWRLINRAKDINDTEVEVFQPELGASQAHQWFYTVTCMNDHPALDRECPGCCIGINHNSYRSQCRQTYSLVYALVTRNRGHSFLWAPVQVPASCNCAITSKSIYFTLPQL